MTDNSTLSGSNGVSVKGPGGFAATFKGQSQILTIILVAFCAFVLYYIDRGFDRMVTALHGQTVAIETMVDRATLEHGKMSDAWDGVTYMLSLPVEQRPRMVPPESVRRRIESR